MPAYCPHISPRDRPRELGAASQMKRKAHKRDTEKAMLPYVRLFGLGLLVLTAVQVYPGATQPRGHTLFFTTTGRGRDGSALS